MSITKKGNSYFGTSQEDIHEELSRYSKLNGLEAHKFKDVVCTCESEPFEITVGVNLYSGENKLTNDFHINELCNFPYMVVSCDFYM